MLRQNWFADSNWRWIGLAAIIVALLWVWAYLPQSPVLRVIFLNVGQGDAIVVRAPGGETALIDAPGPSPGSEFNAGEKTVLPYLKRAGVNTLDAAIITHPHDDHAGGMEAVLRALEAKMVLDCGAAHASPSYLKLLETIEEKNIPFHIARRGDELRLGMVTLRVLNPPPYRTAASLNDRSIVLKIDYGRTSFLLAADAEREAETDMLANCQDLASTVLKIAHHGASGSSSEAFLAAVEPRIAVISVGRNGYGHPASETVERLERRGARIYRTDRHGGVTVQSDGTRLSISTSRG